MKHMKLQILLGALAMATTAFSRSGLSAHGINADDFAKLQQDTPWQYGDRVSVQRTFGLMRDGLAQVQGFQPFRAPAEYVAALICKTVHPVNYQAACAWFHDIQLLSAEAQADEQGADPVSPDCLFALILEAYTATDGFTQKVDSKIRKNTKAATGE